MSERDLTTLRVIGDHLAVRQTDLQAVLASATTPLTAEASVARGVATERAVRAWLQRMTRAGFITRQRVVGVTWVLLTVAGNHAALTEHDPLPYEPRPVSTWVADHATTTLRLRLRLEPEYPEGVWRPERWWRRRQKQSGSRFRVPDGSLDFGDHQTAVEVEITRRRPSRYQQIAREYTNDVEVVWWYTTTDLEPWLARTWAATPRPSRPVVVVRVLPDGCRP